MKKKKRPKRLSEARCYDVEMIRDFISHHTWELRIAVHESQTTGINPELETDREIWFSRTFDTAGEFPTAVDWLEYGQVEAR
jgi:hypothetical protein